MEKPEKLGRESAFSYTCNQCTACCHGAHIPLDPHEIARLARNLKMQTGEFIAGHLIEGGIVLKNRVDGACSMLREGNCSVYADRPTICRTYPLSRRTRAGVEEFLKPKLLSASKGIYGASGTVDGFLKAHDADSFAAASDRYFNLVKQIIETLGATIRSAPDLFGPVRETMQLHYDLRAEAPVPELIDVDRVVAEYCRTKEIVPPTDVEGSIAIHIAAIEEKLAALNAAETVRCSSNAAKPGVRAVAACASSSRIQSLWSSMANSSI